MKVICFHNPQEENGYLSNWYTSEFTADGIRFILMEQYMMYQKAVAFHDGETASKILASDDPREIKMLGRSVRGYDDQYWNGIRQLVVYRGLLEKFSQNWELGRKLLGTGDDILAECAVKDKIWGIGLSMNDPDRLDPSRWKGKNLLGYTLMMVRQQLHN